MNLDMWRCGEMGETHGHGDVPSRGQGYEIPTFVSSRICSAPLGLTFGASGFLLHFYFLIYNNFSVFFFISLESELVLNF